MKVKEMAAYQTAKENKFMELWDNIMAAKGIQLYSFIKSNDCRDFGNTAGVIFKFEAPIEEISFWNASHPSERNHPANDRNRYDRVHAMFLEVDPYTTPRPRKEPLNTLYQHGTFSWRYLVNRPSTNLTVRTQQTYQFSSCPSLVGELTSWFSLSLYEVTLRRFTDPAYFLTREPLLNTIRIFVPEKALVAKKKVFETTIMTKNGPLEIIEPELKSLKFYKRSGCNLGNHSLGGYPFGSNPSFLIYPPKTDEEGASIANQTAAVLFRLSDATKEHLLFPLWNWFRSREGPLCANQENFVNFPFRVRDPTILTRLPTSTAKVSTVLKNTTSS